jgi:hypothetical protein
LVKEVETVFKDLKDLKDLKGQDRLGLKDPKDHKVILFLE